MNQECENIDNFQNSYISLLIENSNNQGIIRLLDHYKKYYIYIYIDYHKLIS